MMRDEKSLYHGIDKGLNYFSRVANVIGCLPVWIFSYKGTCLFYKPVSGYRPGFHLDYRTGFSDMAIGSSGFFMDKL